MNDFITECEIRISTVHELLNQNNEWRPKYKKYAEEINANIETIKKNRKMFRQWKPLYLYMNITKARQIQFGLRYLGQDVAILKAIKEKVFISTKGFEMKNTRDFDCEISLKNCEWHSKDAKTFRKHFVEYAKPKKHHQEHRIESLLLTEFSKKSSKNKKICKIQPVKIAGVARFPMPTPLSASKSGKVTISNSSRGGIDILTRIKMGNSTKLCIMEVKDENVSKEPPKKAVLQGLSYAIFIRELLRSSSGIMWWKIFGFSGKLPKHIELVVASVMPFDINNDQSFGNHTFHFDDDSFQLHYLYFKETNNEIETIETSLKS